MEPDIFDKVISKITEELATLLIIIITSLFAFFRKLPERFLHNYRKNKQLAGLMKGSNINNIVSELKWGGALFIHIIRYHNGGPYKMTIEWEEVGIPCLGCAHPCRRNLITPKPLQQDWQAVKVSAVWNKVVISKTIQLDGAVNTVVITNDGFDQFTKDIWEASKIYTYMEVLLKHSGSKESWCLGLSFCENFQDFEGVRVNMEMAARKLRKLL